MAPARRCPCSSAGRQRAVRLAASYEGTGDLGLLGQAAGRFHEVVSARVLAAAGHAGQLGCLADALALLSGRAGGPAAREEALTVAWVAVAWVAVAAAGSAGAGGHYAAAADRSRCPGTG
jgi:hypothetical protein